MSTEFELDNPPEDSITRVRFQTKEINGTNYLLCSSWDCSVGLYDVDENKLAAKYTIDEPVFDTTFLSSNSLASIAATADGKVILFVFISKTCFQNILQPKLALIIGVKELIGKKKKIT